MADGGLLSFADVLTKGKHIYNGVKDLLTTGDIALRKDFSDSGKSILDKYGKQPLIGVEVFRAPLAEYTKPLFNLITMGDYDKAQKKINAIGIDKIFHLYVIISLKDGTKIKFEKNEVPSLGIWNGAIAPETDSKKVEPFPYDLSLDDLLENAITDMGDKFWEYDAFNNNCIDAGRGILGANGMLSGELDEFLKNPVESLKKEIPDLSTKILKGVTDFSRKARTFFGMGIAFSDKKKVYKYNVRGGGGKFSRDKTVYYTPQQAIERERERVAKLAQEKRAREMVPFKKLPPQS